MKHQLSRPTRQIDQITVADVVRFLLWLPEEEREQAIELLRVVQDRHWHEIWREWSRCHIRVIPASAKNKASPVRNARTGEAE
jgi:hypothetical protein